MSQGNLVKGLSIYIHYPFCQSKCPYCDFNSHVASNIDHNSFKQAYLKELAFFANNLGPRLIKTIYFGGGTPSLMPIDLVEAILDKIRNLWQVDKSCEITFETNPSSFEVDKFCDLKKIGINRISIGVQSFGDNELKFLGRAHSSKEAINAINQAQRIFDNYISFDLIYSLPGQNKNLWSSNLLKALDFNTNHLSLYQLTIEKGTKFFSELKSNKFVMPSDDLSADFYQLTNDITAKAGYEDYEISNYAKISHDNQFYSKHNLNYWQSGEYIGIGAGAHSRTSLNQENFRSAIMMIHDPERWKASVLQSGSGIQSQAIINSKELLEEFILMGLRLKSGISNQVTYDLFGKNIIDIFNQRRLQKLIDQGAITFNQDLIKINQNFRILTNQIIYNIISCF